MTPANGATVMLLPRQRIIMIRRIPKMIEIKFTGENYDDVLSNAFDWFDKAYAALGNKGAPALPTAQRETPERLPAAYAVPGGQAIPAMPAA